MSLRVVAAGVALWAVELLWIRSEFDRHGAFSAGIASTFRRSQTPVFLIDRFILPLLAIQSLSGVVLAGFGPFSDTGRAAIVLLTISFLLGRWRRFLGGDGAEQLAAIILISGTIAVMPDISAARIRLAVVFIAAQVCLSYLTAGIAKLQGPLWRNGAALPAILATHGHGHPGMAASMQAHARLAYVAGWTVIIFECMFTLLLFGPVWFLIAGLLVGALFHFSCAIFMGLNSFVWSFVGAYPCVLATALMIRDLR